MKFSYLTGEIGNVGIAQIHRDWYLGSFSNPIPRSNVVAAYSPWGAASYGLSKVNLANPGVHNLLDGIVLPTWTVNGWSKNGNSYLTTDIIPLPLSDWSMIGYFDSFNPFSGNVNMIAGMSELSSTRGFFLNIGGTINRRTFCSGGQLTILQNLLSGTLAIGGRKAYHNGQFDGNIPAGSTNPPLQMFVMGRNFNGVVDGFFDGRLKRLAIYNIPLSALQIFDLDTTIRVL